MPGILLAPASFAADAPPKTFAPTVSLTLRESYDGNVYMQRTTRLADQESFVTSITPSVGVAYKPNTLINVNASYAPEVTFFHSASSENFVAHRTALGLAGQLSDKTTYDWQSTAAWIDGDGEGVTFLGRGGLPALGGVPIRDRRDAGLYRSSFKLQHNIGAFFLRPVASAYHHDFQTEHRRSAPGTSYMNLVDRNDFNGGIDLGYQVVKGLSLVAGYRYGEQNQANALNNPIEYDNSYHRVLGGLEGKPVEWLKINLLAGPDFRDFAETVPATFEDHNTKLYLDASATITPTKEDSIALAAKRFEQPGYGGASVYEDVTYEITWKHKLTDKLTTSVGGRALNWHFQRPVKRNEWWYGAAAGAAYAFDKHWTAEAGYSYDLVESKVHHTPGREAQRHMAGAAIKYTF